MVRNYILISVRNLRKHFTYSLINILGLGLGLATFLLLVTWIRHELSYDTFHEKADRIYRGSIEYSYGGQVRRLAISPTALMPVLLSLPETEAAVRVYNPSSWNPYVVKKDGSETLFQEKHFYAADSSFFDVFSYRLLSGDPKRALIEPYTVVLTQSMVTKYFGDGEALGKTLQVNGREYTVTGIVEDAPDNSLLHFDFVCSFSSTRWGQQAPVWGSANFQTFVVLHPGASISTVYDKTNEIVYKERGSEMNSGDYMRHNFIPLRDIYLRSDFESEPEVVSDIKYIYLFSAIALIILVIACINYVNLATARAADRAKEVGIRKVVGALRKQLFTQFIGESIIITFLSLCVAFALMFGLLPFFNDLTGKNFSNTILFQPSFIGVALIILLVIALLSGAYPAFAVTSFKPVSVLKGNFKNSGKGIWLRRALVVFQFSISVMLIAGTIIIVKQLDYMRDKKLGYDRENTIALPLDATTKKVFDAFRTEAVRTEAARYVSRGTESPVNILGGYTAGAEGQQRISIAGLVADEDYLPSMNMELIRGRNFTREDRERISNDTVYTFIVNQAALKALYINEEDAIGKRLDMGFRKGEIVGVVKDFHFASLHQNIEPLVIFPEEWQMTKMFIKLPQGNVPEHLAKLQGIYTNLVTHRPFEYEFLDQQYEALYTHEQQLGTVFIVFATLAIIIACLGLLGLVAFSASQKTKEIGIRKVLGATAPAIVLLITKDFSRLIFIAMIIGLPTAVWVMNQWLAGFAYRTTVGVVPIILSSAICVIIALAAAGYQAVKAALIDPAKTLRSE